MTPFRFYSTLPPSRRQIEHSLSEFAELLSEDRYTINQIGDRMMVSRGTACVLLRMLKERCGRQAL